MTVNICDSNVLGENKAAEALDKYIKRLEKRKVKGRTKKQVYSLIKTAKAYELLYPKIKSMLFQKRKLYEFI